MAVLSVKYAQKDSPGALVNKIGWIDYGTGFVINRGDSVLIENTIPGGYTISFTLSLEENNNENVPIISVAPPIIPSISAFGVTGYTGINAPVALYMEDYPQRPKAQFTLTLSNITVTSSIGLPIYNYSIIATDSEITHASEAWSVETNGTPWMKIDTLPTVSGKIPIYRVTGEGSSKVTATSVILAENVLGYVPSIVFSTTAPTEIISVLETSNGKEGIVFGVIINEYPEPIFNCLCCC